MKKHAYTNNWSKSIDHDNELLLRWLHLPSEEQDEWINIRKIVSEYNKTIKRRNMTNQTLIYDNVRRSYVNKYSIDDELLDFAFREAVTDICKIK